MNEPTQAKYCTTIRYCTLALLTESNFGRSAASHHILCHNSGGELCVLLQSNGGVTGEGLHGASGMEHSERDHDACYVPCCDIVGHYWVVWAYIRRLWCVYVCVCVCVCKLMDSLTDLYYNM